MGAGDNFSADGIRINRGYVDLKWGFVPSWANDPRIGTTLINARAETVTEKPTFRKALNSNAV